MDYVTQVVYMRISYASQPVSIRSALFYLTVAFGIMGCHEATEPSTSELHWFQCVVNAQHSAKPEHLVESDDDHCYGVTIRVPAGFHTEESRRASQQGFNPYGGLRIDVSRNFISRESVPMIPPAYARRVRVTVKPIHSGTPFFDAHRPSRTDTFLVGLRGFWNVKDTQTLEHGFHVLETPKVEQKRNYGKRVYAPTVANPDLFAECDLSVSDNRGRRWAPTCRVFTTYENLFELEYHILRADIPRVRDFDVAFKRLLRAWVA